MVACPSFNLQFICIRKQGHAQPLGQGRRDLTGVPIGGPFARQHQIQRPQFGQCRRQDLSRS